MLEEVNLEFEYAVGQSSVALSVEIADDQIGGSSVRLDGERIGDPGTIQNRAIGEGPSLVGRLLLVKTVVADIDDQTDWTSVTYRLSGGVPDHPITARHQVDKDGDGVIYRTTFRFVAAPGENA